MCAQLYKILCDPMDHSLPGYSVLGILQARILEWVAISYSRGSSRPRNQTHIFCISCTGRWILFHCTTWEASYILFPLFLRYNWHIKSTITSLKWSKVKSLSRVQLFVTPWTVAYWAPLSMGFSRQEYWSGLPFPSPGKLPNPETEPVSLALVGRFFSTSASWEVHIFAWRIPWTEEPGRL